MISGRTAAWLLLSLTRVPATGAVTSNCYFLPSDTQWPSLGKWNQLNSTVEGRLIATIPIGTPCHDPHFNQEACEELQEQWNLPQLHLPSSSSVMMPFFANQSCDPFTPEGQPCVLGNYVSYAIDISSPDHVVAGLKFAQENNIRVLVRNTGHDLLGRSTGAGSLALWTQHLKSIERIEWSDSSYNGPAFKFGAGVLGFEAVEAADSYGLVVVTGECPTVGVAGGFAQGGGHSVLSTSFGLAADQALEYEVVTAAGDIVVASPSNNSDLYWALSGGGGGTYGIVLSLTVRAYPSGKIGGSKLSFTVDNSKTFNDAISQFHALLPGMIDQGAAVVYFLNNESLAIQSVTVLNSTGEFVKDTVLGPFNEILSNLDIAVNVSYSTLSYLDHYNTYMGPLPYGYLTVGGNQFGSRLIPKSLLENDNDAFQRVITNLTNHGVFVIGGAASYVAPSDGVPNSVFPPWRESLIQMQLLTPWNNTNWDQNLENQRIITNEINPQLALITPQSGAYLNEADFNEPNWKPTFFGENYKKLLSIKQKWDPNSIFYILKGVGSDAWTIADDGRMCRT